MREDTGLFEGHRPIAEFGLIVANELNDELTIFRNAIAILRRRDPENVELAEASASAQRLCFHAAMLIRFAQRNGGRPSATRLQSACEGAA